MKQYAKLEQHLLKGHTTIPGDVTDVYVRVVGRSPWLNIFINTRPSKASTMETDHTLKKPNKNFEISKNM